MTVYSLAEAKENLDSLLERACTQGEVQIKREDGRVFMIKPIPSTHSPLDVHGADLGLSMDEIVTFVREVRQR
jgi:hypothetical protein